MSEYVESICRGCFHSYVCEQFNEHRDSDNKKCHYYNDHYVPAADVVEVVGGYNVGDFCIYGFADENKSLAIVEIVKILDDARGVAEIKFHKVVVDDTGNGLFEYLLRSGKTMNGSFKYLKNITPKAEREDGGADNG